MIFLMSISDFGYIDNPIFLAFAVKHFIYTIVEDSFYEMTTIAKNHKTATVLVAISALATMLVVSTSAIGSGHIALASHDDQTIIIKALTYLQTQSKSKCVKPLVKYLPSQTPALSPPGTPLLKAFAFTTSNTKKHHRTQIYPPYSESANPFFHSSIILLTVPVVILFHLLPNDSRRLSLIYIAPFYQQ